MYINQYEEHEKGNVKGYEKTKGVLLTINGCHIDIGYGGELKKRKWMESVVIENKTEELIFSDIMENTESKKIGLKGGIKTHRNLIEYKAKFKVTEPGTSDEIDNLVEGDYIYLTFHMGVGDYINEVIRQGKRMGENLTGTYHISVKKNKLNSFKSYYKLEKTVEGEK